MEWSTVVGLVVLAVAAFFVMRAIVAWRGKPAEPTITAHGTIEGMRAIGELAVYRVYTKEIVTQTDHSWGETGQRYLSWLLTKKKMVMIFEFEIEFRFDLRDPAFRIEELAPKSYVLRMPPAQHRVHIRDISVYDEQKARILPWLLPDLLNGFIAGSFPEQDKNRLIAAAREHAESRAREQIEKLQKDLRASAEGTLRPVALAFGAREVRFEFDAEARAAVVVDLAERVAA